MSQPRLLWQSVPNEDAGLLPILNGFTAFVVEYLTDLSMLKKDP
jgi:hypothetical protein